MDSDIAESAVTEFGKTNAILQYNIQGLETNKGYLDLLIQEYRPLIIAIQETNYKKFDLISTYKNYNCFIPYHPSKVGGVGFMIHAGLNYSDININSNLDVIAITTKLPFIPYDITIVNIYINHSTTINYNTLENIRQQIKPPFIILGDLNTRSETRGDYFTSERGDIIDSWLENNQDLVVLNDNTPTYITTKGRETVPDITIAHVSIAYKLNWKVVNNPKGYDHYPIIVSLDRPITEKQHYKARPHFKVKLADWTKFQTEIDKFLDKHTPTKDINKETAILTKAIRTAANFAIPRIVIKKEHNKPHWYNAKINKLEKNRDRLWRSYKRSPNSKILLEVKRNNAILRREIKVAKKEKWEDFANSINNTNSSETWERARRILKRNKRNPLTYIEIDNEITTNNKDIANHFLTQYILDQGENVQEPNMLNNTENINYISNNRLNKPISEEEIKRVLKNAKGTSPGMDGISYAMVANASIKYRRRLKKLYNNIFSS